MSVPERESASLFIEDESGTVERYAQPVAFAAGTCIFQAGSPGDSCYFIDRGRVRIELDRNELDSEDVLGFLEPGSTLGEISILDGMPRSATAFAHTDVEARRLSKEGLEQLRETYPRALAAVYLALGRNAAVKLRNTNERLGDAIFPTRDPEVDELVARASVAQKEIQDWPEELRRPSASPESGTCRIRPVRTSWPAWASTVL